VINNASLTLLPLLRRCASHDPRLRLRRAPTQRARERAELPPVTHPRMAPTPTLRAIFATTPTDSLIANWLVPTTRRILQHRCGWEKVSTKNARGFLVVVCIVVGVMYDALSGSSSSPTLMPGCAPASRRIHTLHGFALTGAALFMLIGLSTTPNHRQPRLPSQMGSLLAPLTQGFCAFPKASLRTRYFRRATRAG
jgi:hypothetical protein